MQPQNKTTNKRRMVLLSTLYGCLIYPVVLVFGMSTSSVLLDEPDAFDLGYLMGVTILVAVYMGVYALFVGPLVGLLIGLFIEFKRTGSLWRAAGGGALIGFVVGVVLAGIMVGISTFPVQAGIGVSLVSTLAAMATALAVGLALRALRYRP
jgi:hypothetical protein